MAKNKISFIDEPITESTHIVNATLVNSTLALGLCPAKLKEKGYVGTIAASFHDKFRDGEPVNGFQDLHVTKKQLEELRAMIDVFLNMNNEEDQELQQQSVET